jgi:polysaccharide biosynthesis protein PslA
MMKTNLASVSDEHRSKISDPVIPDYAIQGPADAVAAPIERRSPVRRGSRGDNRRISQAVTVRIVQASDLALLLFSGWLAKITLTPLNEPRFDGSLFLAALVGSVVAAVFFSRTGAYHLCSLSPLGKSLGVLAPPLLVGGCSMIVCLFLMRKGSFVFREWPFLWLFFSAALLIASRCSLSRLLSRWTESGKLARRVAVIGAGELSREFIERLRAEPHAYTLVGLYDDRRSRLPEVQDGDPVRGTVRDLLRRSREEQVDLIVIALPLRAVVRISRILEEVGSAVADICLTTDLAGFRYKSSQISFVGSNPVVLIDERPLKEWQAGKKFAFDIVIGTLLLIMLAPLLALIALAIHFDSPGPVLFRQPRLGFNNRLFTCYKFRSMHHAMTDLMGDRQATRGDPRVTRLGKWLRALSLDELPQIFNVMKGNMSLVGPRPHPPNTKAADKLFTDVVANYAFRHRVKPGITGWAQVNGWRGETKTVEEIENRVACDLAYIENWSVWFDLRIMMLTITREILSRHAF